MDILGTISVILGIITSCITIYEFILKKTPPTNSPQSAVPRQPSPSHFQQYPSRQAYYPSQRQGRTFSWGGCVGTTIGIALSLILLVIIPLFIYAPAYIIVNLGHPKILVLVGVIIPLIALLVGIAVGFRRGRR